jgi:hypothetical protein
VVHHEKSSEEKEMDTFLDEEDKKIVSDGIRQRNREKELKKAEQASLNQDQESGTSNPEGIIPAVSNPVTKISAGAPLPTNVTEISEKILPEVNASTTPMPAEDVSASALTAILQMIPLESIQ